jgi:hypothetical protein
MRDTSPLVTSVRKLFDGARDWPMPTRNSVRPPEAMRWFHWPLRRSSEEAY